MLTFNSRDEWRSWLSSHYDRVSEAWLVLYKKGPRRARQQVPLSLDEAQEVALCFGWIDHLSKSLDNFRFMLRFTPRRAGSIWSITNINRVERLRKAGLMSKAGLEKVAEAKRNGQWQAAIARERTDLIPEDLAKALRKRKGAIGGYRGLTNSRKKQLLHWLLTAKSQATRQRRLEEIVQEAAK